MDSSPQKKRHICGYIAVHEIISYTHTHMHELLHTESCAWTLEFLDST